MLLATMDDDMKGKKEFFDEETGMSEEIQT